VSGDSVPHAQTAWLYGRDVPSTKQAPPPLQVDTARVVLVGTALWALALVVLLILGDRVAPVWTWTCVAAIGLAFVGLFVMRLQGQLGRRAGAATGQAAAARSAAAQSVRTSNSEVS
jgi:hypothetical protein